MRLIPKSIVVLGVCVLLIAGIAIGMSLNAPTVAQGPGVSANGRYHVVETDGMSLIVTDNQKNITFFYTVDEGAKPGSDLHLRGTVDLTSVGQATMKPTLIVPK